MRNSIPENVKMSKSMNVFKQKLRIFLLDINYIGVGRRHDGCSKTTNWWQQNSRWDSVPTWVLKK